ncbi:DNRLRE domain-containing protein [Spirillospora sp. NPDC049024]
MGQHGQREVFSGGHHRPDARRSLPVPPDAPRRRRGRRRGSNPFLYFATAGTLLVVGGSAAAIVLSGSGTVHNARTAAARGHSTVPASADTYVVREMPGTTFGGARKITASRWPGWHTEAYVAFDVPPGTPAVAGARVEMAFDRLENRPRQVELRTLPGSWTEEGTSWSNRPVAGPVVATAPADSSKVSFDVGRVVNGPGHYAFAITGQGRRSAVSLHSRETGDGPRLVLRTRPGAPAPTPSNSPETSGTALPAPGPEPTWEAPQPVKTPTTSPVGGRTLCGLSLELKPGETFQNALARMDAAYGGLETVRLFYQGVPPAWPGKPDTGKRPPIISFKLAPKDVIAGKYDQAMTRWFATAPRDRDLYWVYYHEPEDNIAAGEFTAADYRAAWRRLRSLADKADNPRIHATLVLMGWSLDPLSKRDWRDYYPGRDVIQVLGWDVYNLGWKKGRYDDPATMYDRVVAVSKGENLPFGVAETGSYLVSGDNGDRRASWLRAMNAYLTKRNALWVAYFDLDWSTGDFRLLDTQSRQAWSDFC